MGFRRGGSAPRLPAMGASRDERADRSSECHGKRVTVHGTDGDDVVRSSSLHPGDVVALGEGDDYVLLQRVGRVTICGGPGRDRLSAGEHAGRRIVLLGEEGRDSVGSAFYGGSPKVADHSLRVFGGFGRDYLEGSEPGQDQRRRRDRRHQRQ